MSTVAKKIMMGSGSTVDLPSDDEFNSVSFLSHFDGANNGDNNAFDDGSASNHTITANGDVTQGSFGPFARPDGEWAFNNTASTNDSFKVTAHDNFDMTNPFTIEGWIFLSDLTANKLLFGRENNYWMTHDFQAIGGASGKFGFNYQNSGSWGAINASAATVANTWYFLQATYVGTTVTFYINGASQGTASVGSPSSNTDKPFYVLSGPGEKATGTASNVRLSSVARSTSLPTAKFTSDSDTELLVCQSNRFVDNGPDGHTITTTAGASVSAFGPFLTSKIYSAATNGASAYFDGTGDYLTVATSQDFNLGTNDFTISAWVYSANNNSIGIIGDMNNSGDTDNYQLWWNHSVNQIRLGTANLSNLIGWGVTLHLNSWNNVVVSRASGAIKFFFNGTEITSRAADSGDLDGAAFNAMTPAYIGRFNDGAAQLNGYMTDVRIIKGSAVNPSGIPTAPLTAITNTKLLLNMADGQAFDSAAQNTLTLVNDAKISTTRAKFGDTSLYFDGSDYAIIDNSSSRAFGTGDFTVELFIWLNGSPDQFDYIFDMRNSSDLTYTWALSFNYMGVTNNKLQFCTNNTSATLVLSADYPSLNQWVHIAVCRSGTTTRMFYDGTQVAIKTSDTFDYRDTGYSGYVGGRHSNQYYINAYMDEIRFSKMARYTSNFTAPSEPFADKGK